MYYLHNQYKGNACENDIKLFHKNQFLKMCVMLLKWDVKHSIFHVDYIVQMYRSKDGKTSSVHR